MFVWANWFRSSVRTESIDWVLTVDSGAWIGIPFRRKTKVSGLIGLKRGNDDAKNILSSSLTSAKHHPIDFQLRQL
jgi:hypothetical protein